MKLNSVCYLFRDHQMRTWNELIFEVTSGIRSDILEHTKWSMNHVLIWVDVWNQLMKDFKDEIG